jgi:hypothetical protein
MKASLIELDRISGPECAIFIVESPSARWVEMTRKKNHPWWRLFGSSTNIQASDTEPTQVAFIDANTLLQALAQNKNLILFQLQPGEIVTQKHLLEPSYQSFYDRNEIWDIADRFGIASSQVPCLFFFKDFDNDEEDITVVDLTDLRTQWQIKRYFRHFFDSPEFKHILSKARTNA